MCYASDEMIPECATASCQGLMRGGKSVFAASDIQVTMKAVALRDAKNQMKMQDSYQEPRKKRHVGRKQQISDFYAFVEYFWH